MRNAVVWLVGLCLASPVWAGELRVSLRAASGPAPVVASAPAASPATAWEIPLPLSLPRAKAAPEGPVWEGVWLVLLPKKAGKAPKPPKVVLKEGAPSPQVVYVSPGDEVVFASKQEAGVRFLGEDPLLLVEGRARRAFASPGAYPYQVEDGAPGLVIAGEGARCVAASAETVTARLEAGEWRVLLVRPGAVVEAGEVKITKEGKTNLDAILPPR